MRRKGSALVGDVHPAVAQVAGVMTPVPGGVGPLTIVMLLVNSRKVLMSAMLKFKWLDASLQPELPSRMTI